MPQTQAQSEVHQIGVDTRTRDRPSSAPDRRIWPAMTRELARELARAEGLSVAETRRRLSSDHGIDVSASTLGHWLRTGPTASSDPQSIRERICQLAARELAALEKQRRGKVDLRRLEALGRILKSAEAERPSRQQAVGLARFAALAQTPTSDATPIDTFGSGAAPIAEPIAEP